MHVYALHLGAIQTLQYEGKAVRTAGHKGAVASGWVTALGLLGDEQADRRYHGGPDRALCAYGWEHYASWQARLGRELVSGSFSENLTLAGFDEGTVCLGDRYSVGDGGVVVEVSSPRQPCSRLAAKLGQPDLVSLMTDTGHTGCYLRVLSEGEIRVGDRLELRLRPPVAVTLLETNQVQYRQRCDRESLLRVLSVEALAESWRKRLEQRLR